jgi:ABC-2 type transport system ATP-binding protein
MKSINGKQTEYIEVKVQNIKKAVYILEEKLGIRNFKIIGEQIIRIYETVLPQQEISKVFVMNDIGIESINKKHSSLEEYFLSSMNGEGISV